MRISVILLCLCSFSAYGQTIFPNQSRQVISSAEFGALVGSPLLATPPADEDVVGWSIDLETNPTENGVLADELFFALDNGGQITVLQDLGRFFPAAGNAPFVEVTLAVRAFFSDGSVDGPVDMTITVVEDTSTPGSAPIIPSGITRNVMVTAQPGDNVGDAVFAANEPDSFTILSVNNHADQVIPGVDADERFFDIDNGGQITVLQSLERFFQVFALTRGEQVFIEMVLQADNVAGTDTETIRVYIIEGTNPAILSTQSRVVTTDEAPDTAVGDPLLAVGDPTYWAITGGSNVPTLGGGTISAAGLFAIDNEGQITNTSWLDVFAYTSNPFPVTLNIVCGNQYGQSSAFALPLDIVQVATNRCGYIPATQTRYVRSSAGEGTDIGDPIAAFNIESLWIEEAYIDNPANTDVASYFTITTGGQLFTSRALALLFDTEAITKVDVTVRGVATGEQCPEFVDQIFAIYVLPSDATTGGGGGGNTSPDFSEYIDDAALLSCIRERVGIVVGDPLTAEQVLALGQLDCACRNDNAIADLDGLHLFTSLAQLNLSNNIISDIRPISSLTNLTDLRLAGNMIEDVTTSNPLASLTQLTTLDLSYNQIRETNAFSTLSALSFISLAYNDICDVTSLVALANANVFDETSTIHLDGNHLLTSGGQQQITALVNTNALVTVDDNDAVCPATLKSLQLPDWPERGILPYAELINFNFLGVPCN